MLQEELMSVQCVTKAVFNPASLSVTYQAMNGTGFDDTIKILKIYNPSTTVSIDVSLDGVNNHDFIPPLSTLIVDFQTNHADSASYGAGTLNVRRGQILWGKTAESPTFLQMIGYK
jgi:hypothetical protein